MQRLITENRHLKLEKTDTRLAIIFVSLYFVHNINNTLKSTLLAPGSMWKTISYAAYIIGGILILTALRDVALRYPRMLITVEGIGAILYCFSFMFNHDSIVIVLERTLWTLGLCIPMGLMAFSITNKQILYNTMLAASYFLTILISLVFFLNGFGSYNTYDMSFSYSMLYPLLIHLNEFFNSRKPFHLVLSVYQITLVLLYGSRGAIFCFSVLIIIKIVKEMKSIAKQATIIGFGGIAVILFYANFESIGNYLLSLLTQKGYYSRTLTSFFNRSILQSSGRSAIQAEAYKLILQKPFLGWGLGGEIQLLGTYPHNIFIELLLDFGMILGVLACVFVLYSIVRIFFIEDKITFNLVLIYLCAGFLPLLLSSTYLMHYDFFIYLFLSYQAIAKTVLKREGTATIPPRVKDKI